MAIARKRPILGFDVRDWPGDAAVRRLRERYRFTGYYLVSPNHPGDSWKGKWPRLRKWGLGVAIVYVGQQRSELTWEQGIEDALDAAQKASAERFPKNAILFLDVERQDSITPEMREYVSAWLTHLKTNRKRRFRPGIYCHVRNASELRAIAGDVPFWVSGGTGFDVKSKPSDSGVAFASMWQGSLDDEDPFSLVDFPLDVSVSRVTNPSMPQ